VQELEQFGEFGGVNPSITDSATYSFLQENTMIDAFHGEAEGCFYIHVTGIHLTNTLLML